MRSAAEAAAKVMANKCQLSGFGRLKKQGTEYLATGGYDDQGPWYFALDYKTPQDRADVDAWLATQ